MRRATAGFTMVEMLVAVGILGVVVAGVMETFVVQNRAYSVVDETTEAQQNLRAISYLIERDLRGTGFMVDEAAAVCGIDNTNAPDTLYVTDPEPIDPEGATSATLGVTVNPTSPTYTTSISQQWLRLNSLVLDVDAPNPAAYFDADGNGTPDSDFMPGRAAILFDTANPARGTACGLITDVDVPGNRVRVAFENMITAGGSLVLVPAIAYTVDTTTDTNGDGVAELRLLRNGLPLANEVEDFQVAYFLDADGNGLVTNDDEYPGSADATNPYQSRNTDHSDLREVRFNIVVRQRNEDVTYSEGFQQATENRAAVGLNDGFRRRVFTSTVRQRNIGYRGVQPAG
jgi:prepilin-type N-terminal cleavage/methylation domain-containing protein